MTRTLAVCDLSDWRAGGERREQFVQSMGEALQDIGFFALTGQCVAFPQQVADICTDLPRHPNEIVTYIRQLGNSETSTVHLKHLRVRRNKVIDALKWLKLHHIEYKDITINESKFDWMEGRSKNYVLQQIRKYQIKGDDITQQRQKPSVSKVQCLVDNDSTVNLDYTTITDNANDAGIDPDQKDVMDELINTTKITKQNDKLLMFPPHGNTPVK